MTLRRIVDLPLAPPPRLVGLGRRAAQATLEVVEDETDRRLGDGRRGDPPRAFANDEHAPVLGRDLELRDGAVSRRALEQLCGRTGERGACRLVGEGRSPDRAALVEQHRRLDLRRDLGQVREGLGGVHLAEPNGRLPQVRLRKRALVAKFFADRGTHLAAMVAYFALLSFVPLTFLSLSLLGFAHRADASDFLVKELGRAFPGSSVSGIVSLVHRVQDNAAVLGIVGGVLLVWSSLSLFRALESAFNIVYGRPNRPFLRGKGVAAVLMAASVTTLFVSLLVGALGVEVAKRYAPGFVGNGIVAYVAAIAVSVLGVFVFLVAAYRLLTNAPVTVRDALPGAVLAALVLEASFQVVPVFVRIADLNLTLRILGGPAILLLWLYVMANVIVFGAELNWWFQERRKLRDAGETVEGVA